MTADREELSWELFGTAADEFGGRRGSDGFAPDLILAVARGGLFVAGALGYALEREERRRDQRGVLHRRGRATGRAGGAAAGAQHRRPRRAHGC